MDTKNTNKPVDATTEAAKPVNATPVADVAAKPVDATPELPALSATMPVGGLITLRGDGQTQSAYNLAIHPSETEALTMLQRLADHFNDKPELDGKTPISITNADGETFIAVKIDAKSVGVLKRPRAFEVNVKGELRITGSSNGQFRGQLVVIGATAADILTGGRIVERTANPDRDVTSAPATGRRGLSGFRV